MTAARYDRIGAAYAVHRRPDPRIGRRILAALGEARWIANVGAGTGSYEPADRLVIAVEPSAVMIAQRPAGSAPVVRAVAEALPFATGSFDAALALLTVHHWQDKARGLAEMRRVARRCVVLCFDPALEHDFWAVRDYWPEVSALDQNEAPNIDVVAQALSADRVESISVPWDCTDGFFGAYWRRPASYLDPDVRACISGLARLDAAVVERGAEQLRADLSDGTWHRKNAELLDRGELDLGYRLVIAG